MKVCEPLGGGEKSRLITMPSVHSRRTRTSSYSRPRARRRKPCTPLAPWDSVCGGRRGSFHLEKGHSVERGGRAASRGNGQSDRQGGPLREDLKSRSGVRILLEAGRSFK